MPELYQNIKQANSQYIPQFVGSNAEALKEVGDTLDKRYRANKDFSDRMAIEAATDEYAPEDQHIGDAHLNDIKSTIEELASSKKNFENSSGVISQLAKRHFTDRTRLEALKNQAKIRAYQDEKAKMGSEGIDFTPEFKGTVGPNGEINRFQHNLEKKLDWDKQKEQYFNQIEASIRQNYRESADIPGLMKGILTGGITDTTIKNYAKEAFTRHQGTAEYQQEKKDLARQGLNQDQIDNQIQKSLIATGLERVHSISKQELHNLSASSMKGLYPAGEGPSAGTMPGGVMVNEVHQPLSSEATDQTIYQENGKNYQWLNKNTGEPLANDKNPLQHGNTDPEAVDWLESNYTKTPVNNQEAFKELDKQYKKIVSNVGNIYNGDFNAYRAAVEGAKKLAGNVTATGSDVSPSQAETYNQEINSNGSVPIFTPDGPTTLDQLAKKLKTSPSNISFKTSKIFHESPSKQLPGGYVEAKLVVDDKNVKEHPTVVRIPLNNQGQAVSRNIDNVYKGSLYRGSDQYTIEHPYTVQDINGSPLVSKNGNQMVIWTTTYPKPVDQQVPGQIPYETVIHKGIRNPNGTVSHETNMTPSIYKEYVEKIMRGRIIGTLNSGQTFNATDINPKTKLGQEEE